MPLYLRKLLEDIEIRLAKVKAFSKVKMTKTIKIMERLEQIKVIANNFKTGFTKAVKALL